MEIVPRGREVVNIFELSLLPRPGAGMEDCVAERIGGWWLARVDPLPGEAVLWSVGANRNQSADRAAGGLLYVTSRRLVFCPHLLDFWLAGETWMVEHSRIQAVEKNARSGYFFGGGLRDRLLIRRSDGSVDLFVVNHLDLVIERLREVLG